MKASKHILMDRDKAVKGVTSLAALITGSLSALIFIFLVYFSFPLITSGILGKFLVENWDPQAHRFGIFPMIIGTVYIAGLAMLWAAPLSLGLATFIEIFAPKPLGRLLDWVVQFMSGIPTVVYGFCGLFLLVPMVRSLFRYGSGLCVLSASLVLAFLIVPTITLIARDRLAAVPQGCQFAAYSLGASKMEVFLHVQLPQAWRGLLSAVILGCGRALGDTLIALMLAGNAVAIPHSVLDPARTLTSHIALVTAADYESLNFKSIFTCGLVLFIFSAWNIAMLRVIRKVRK